MRANGTGAVGNVGSTKRVTMAAAISPATE